MRIKPLTQDLRNKISAGEVVERPASVVKELVENSLDAGATEISIIVEKGGHQLLQVTDNGSGISADDLPLAFQRYSTSKLYAIDDLFRIETLGFRGEALASIASVARIKVVSCTPGEDGAELEVEGETLAPIKPAPQIRGTQITIRDLFYNTPVRKKFLKTPRIEFRKIVEMVRRFALAYPEITFRLVSDEREILNLTPENLDDRIVAVMDPAYRGQLLAVDYSKGDYFISGYVGNLNLVRNRAREQYIFLNRRYIQNRLLNSGVYQAYQSLLKRGEYPFFALNLALPPDQVDVNVHPMKTEVRFQDEWRVYHVLKSAVSEALTEILATIPDFEKRQFDSRRDWQGTIGNRVQTWSSIPPDPDQLGLKPTREAKTQDQNRSSLERAKTYVSSLPARDDFEQNSISIENIWQVHTKYIVSQISSGLVIIDQHVAHERVLYEEAMAAMNAQPMAAQTLLFPEVLEFSADEFSVLLDVLPFLEKMGFRMKEFGINTVMIEAIPSEMGWGNEKKIIRDILDEFLKTKKTYSSFQEALATSFACKAAVKAGDVLTKAEMQELVNRLFGSQHPYYCPHGRPIIVQLSLDELDHRFERS
ncbi:MAG: DNA mismatch repair endonuclease MutL [Fidelibacterota bacterium]